MFNKVAVAYGGPAGRGKIRCRFEDFVVEENLGFELTGEGEHFFLFIRKKGENTDWVGRQLAKFAGVTRKAVGCAGLKDRFAVASQWFSVQLPGLEGPDWKRFSTESMLVLEVRKHRQKLKKGGFAGNHFHISVREIDGDRDRLEAVLEEIKSNGVPNYFGSQRLGHDGQNITQAVKLFRDEIKVKNRHLRGLYLSAARSFLFNRMLSSRVARGNWDRGVDGDLFMFKDSRFAFFHAATVDDDIARRVSSGAIIPAGTLWGKGEPLVSGAALTIEEEIRKQENEMCWGLERFGLERSHRPLRLQVKDLQWSFLGKNELSLSFFLRPGGYATAVLREILYFSNGFVKDGSENNNE